MSNNPKNTHLHKLPTADPVGALETVAFFNDAMPT